MTQSGTFVLPDMLFFRILRSDLWGGRCAPCTEDFEAMSSSAKIRTLVGAAAGNAAELCWLSSFCVLGGRPRRLVPALNETSKCLYKL